MKKLLLLALTVLTAVAFAAPRGYAASRADYVKRFESCEAILREFMADRSFAIPTPVLQRARGFIIVNQFKAGFIFGVKGGYGVIIVKKPDGKWSVPVLIDAGEASFGLQLGGKADETIYVLMDDATPRLLFNDRVNFGADAKAVAGPKWAEIETTNHAILDAPVLVYTKSKGLYAGATVKAGYVARDDDANRVFYKTTYTLPELLYGNFVTAPDEVKPLIEFVQQITK
jgi:lipid-binding SYLF domain-containing protein